MDRKRIEGDPLTPGGLKKIEAKPALVPPDASELLAPSHKEVIDQTPERYKGLKCPCGKEYKDCEGFLGGIVSRDDTFEVAAERAGR